MSASPTQSYTLSEAELNLIQSLPQPMVCCRIDGTVLLVNPAAQQMLGVAFGRLQSVLLGTLFGVDVRNHEPLDLAFVQPTGDTLELQAVPSLLYDHETNPRLLLLTLYDVSAQKRAEAAEHEQHQFSQALRDTAAELSRSLDLDSVLNAILDNVGRVVPHDAATILLVEGTTARCVLQRGYSPEAAGILAEHPVTTSLPNLQQMMQTREACLISDVLEYDGWQTFEHFECNTFANYAAKESMLPA